MRSMMLVLMAAVSFSAGAMTPVEQEQAVVALHTLSPEASVETLRQEVQVSSESQVRQRVYDLLYARAQVPGVEPHMTSVEAIRLVYEGQSWASVATIK